MAGKTKVPSVFGFRLYMETAYADFNQLWPFQMLSHLPPTLLL
jgi:hypothetical protein